MNNVKYKCQIARSNEFYDEDGEDCKCPHTKLYFCYDFGEELYTVRKVELPEYWFSELKPEESIILSTELSEKEMKLLNILNQHKNTND